MRRLSSIEEGMWRSVVARSSGNEARMEDDINSLDPEDFCEYLKNRYEEDETFKIRYNKISHLMTIPIMMSDYGTIRRLYINHGITRISPSFFNEYKYIFDDENIKVEGPGGIHFILRKNGETDMTNKDIIKIVDSLIDTCSKPLLNKKSL